MVPPPWPALPRRATFRWQLRQRRCRHGDQVSASRPVRPDAVDPTGVIVTLVTDDVNGWHERLAAAAVVCERPPNRNQRYAIYQAFYRDPDGYLIEIQQFLDPEWPQP